MNKEIEIPEGYEARIDGNKVIIELKESNDERIRKELIGMINECTNWPHKKEYVKYLEKQKEQKFESTALQKAFTSSQIDYTLEEKCDASDYADAILPTSVACGENDEEYKLHKIIEAAFIAGQKKEQKPAEWSERDELMLRRIIERGESFVAPGGVCSLLPEHTEWLRLRLKLLCNHWKPSKEQMDNLLRAINIGNFGENKEIRTSLHNLFYDLKKLIGKE